MPALFEEGPKCLAVVLLAVLLFVVPACNAQTKYPDTPAATQRSRDNRLRTNCDGVSIKRLAQSCKPSIGDCEHSSVHY